MKLHIEATTTTWHEGWDLLTDEEVAAYQALGTDDERKAWLEDMAREAVWSDDHSAHTEIASLDWHLEEDDDE